MNFEIAIISDIHDNLPNLKQCLTWCRINKVNKIICCGDVTNSETLDFLANGFIGEIFLIRGNMDIYDEDEIKKYDNINYLGRSGITEMQGYTVGICHEPLFINELLKQKSCNIIFYGHTHKPWIENKDGVELVNPGNLGNVFQKGTFAVWNNNKIELKILETL